LSGGQYLVVWQNETVDGGLGGIFGRTVATDGTVGAGPYRYDAAGGVMVREDPDVAANAANNEFGVVWDEWDTVTPPSLGKAMIRRAAADGTPLGATTDIDPFSPGADHKHTAVAWNDETNLYFVLWFHDPDGDFADYQVRAARIDASTLEIVDADNVLATPGNNTIGGSGDRLTDAAARSGTSHVIGVWVRDTGSAPYEYQARRFDMADRVFFLHRRRGEGVCPFFSISFTRPGALALMAAFLLLLAVGARTVGR
jgi:hypothetical protein